MSNSTVTCCKLCRTPAALLRSHIVPKFVIRWMKETGTGYLRSISSPNVRLQDGTTEPLLCAACEQLFSKHEHYFASEFFKPLLSGPKAIPYDERLAYFLISLLWRVVQVHLEEMKTTRFQFLVEAEAAASAWRDYLLQPTCLVRFNHLHFVQLDLAEKNPPGVPHFNLFCLRALDSTLIWDKDRCFVLMKFARFCFLSPITPYDESKWQHTRIAMGRGTLQFPQTVEDLILGGWLMTRARGAFERMEAGLSTRQRAVIKTQAGKRLTAIVNSDLIAAYAADNADSARVVSSSVRVGRNDKCPCGSGIKFKKCHGKASFF